MILVLYTVIFTLAFGLILIQDLNMDSIINHAYLILMMYFENNRTQWGRNLPLEKYFQSRKYNLVIRISI